MAGYISKDFIHYGCGLELNPSKVLQSVPHSVRKNIKKAGRAGIVVRRAEGKPVDINILRSMWYDPSDPNIPAALSDSDYMFIAFEGELPVGVCVLLPSGRHLFLNNLAGSERGKRLRVQDYLLWHCVNYFSKSEFDYIDVGVSYRPSLYRFFTKWQTFTYPVIFNKPIIELPIKSNPFLPEYFQSQPDSNMEMKTLNLLRKMTGGTEITFTPDLKSAKMICTSLDADPKETTFDFPKIDDGKMSIISLPDIFSCQFGAIILNLKIGDDDMWNKYGCLDVFKRRLTLSGINMELNNFDKIISRRKSNYRYLEKLFMIDNIRPSDDKLAIKSYFNFICDEHKRYQNKLLEFGIEHKYDKKSGEIGLPVHQNLKNDHLDYMYAIYRGVLNLCSEWNHSDKYNNYK